MQLQNISRLILVHSLFGIAVLGFGCTSNFSPRASLQATTSVPSQPGGNQPEGPEGSVDQPVQPTPPPPIDESPKFYVGPGSSSQPRGNRIEVSDVNALRAAVSSAQPGDVITLRAGTYHLTSQISFNRGGTASNPIYLRADSLGSAVITVDTPQAFLVQAQYWVFENLEMKGVCANDSDCEHAFHMVGGSDHFILRNSRIYDFNAHVKGNGNNGLDLASYPSDVLIENNDFYATRTRQTGNPVTWIDIVGGRRWIVRSNIIRDFHKADGISYGAFLKGNSSDGLFERNLVMCAHRIPSSDTRIGLSFGGGGTGQPYCMGQDCTREHSNGVMRNNVIMNCSDVGIYLNKAYATTIVNNTLYNTLGIDVRYSTSSANVSNNIIDSRGIVNREGGTHSASDNLIASSIADFANWFTAPSSGDFSLKNGSAITLRAPIKDATSDFCGQARTPSSDLGAIQYSSGADCSGAIKSAY